MTDLIMSSDVLHLHKLYIVTLRYLNDEAIRQGLNHVVNQPRAQDNHNIVEDNEVNEREQHIKDIEMMLQDPEVSKTPTFFLKISNSYFMSAQKYTDYLKNFLFKKRTKPTASPTITTEAPQKAVTKSNQTDKNNTKTKETKSANRVYSV